VANLYNLIENIDENSYDNLINSPKIYKEKIENLLIE
jgi:hypothetical protein